ncbi:LOW QUALITY PROTEIN: hypothetical protein DH2020_007363 [Rehmannia glutinosa]|uniref:Mannitol dehydrogenase n=1 Tax=Rehmannia glutinosa TaxID=99300 RepID=A0ABR0TYC8_REHGL
MAKTVNAFGWGAKDTKGFLTPLEFTRRTTGDRDVRFKVLSCGVCHSDLHMIKDHWGFAHYPDDPPGRDRRCRDVFRVQKFKVGDNVGVRVIVDACRKCDQCVNNLENYCPERIDTYNGVEPDGSITYGGYSDIMVANEEFVIRWLDNFPMDKGAPLVCAGITTYSPLRYYGLDKSGLHIGVVGLGGLGHMAVKFLKAFGTKSTEVEATTGTLDGILDCVSVIHSLQGLLDFLKPHEKLVVVGLPEKPLELPIFSFTMGRKMMGGSMIGGLKVMQEMIDFAAKHNILPEVEIISMDYVNTAMERLARGDVKFRFVIDIGKTLKAG